MKKAIILLIVFFFTLPSYAWSEKAYQKSLSYLNQSVKPNVKSIKQSVKSDSSKIVEIVKLYKLNPELIKTKEINEFGYSCKQRNEILTKSYNDNYFKPAYKEYLKYDKSMNFDEWVNTTALCEISEFYDFYTLTERNIEDCQKIIERSTSH